MTLKDEIATLPDSVKDGDANHNSHHGVLHRAAKDHEQRVTNLGAALAGKAPALHGHPVADVSGLQGALDGKAATSHTHVMADISDLAAVLASKQTAAQVEAIANAAAAGIVNGSPAALDTLQELAAALGNDPNFAATIASLIGTKAPLASPALTGVPSAPTAASGTNTTQLATTAFVKTAVSAASTGTTPAVLVYSGGVYPARPAGLAGGLVTYIGPVQPTTWLANDEWRDNS